MARDNLLSCPYFNEEFKVHINNSDFQLGAVISQNVKPSLSVVENYMVTIKVIQ